MSDDKYIVQSDHREMRANVRIFRDIDKLKIWGNELGFRLLRDPDDKTKYKVYFTDDDVDKLESFVRQQQTEIEFLQAKRTIAYNIGFEDGQKANEVIYLTKAEIQSGLSRVKWAELLIKQLPEEHEGRNSWLLNYGSEK